MALVLFYPSPYLTYAMHFSYLQLTVHMIGKSDRGQGYKTKEIERVTGFSVSISHLDRINNIPVCITLKTMYPFHQSDKVKAKVMIETSLLEFAEFDGGKAKLLDEWTSPFATSRKRKPDDTLTAYQNEHDITQRPTKTLKSQEDNIQNTISHNEATCKLTVPLWAMQTCSCDKELFSKLIDTFLIFVCRSNLSQQTVFSMRITIDKCISLAKTPQDIKQEK